MRDYPFFRFPHTPHLAWLGPGQPRDDKLLDEAEVEALLDGEVAVEEKLDGANLGLSLDPAGAGLRAQNRGHYLEQPFAGQFARLGAWLGQHGWRLAEELSPSLIVFGEWCAAQHSLDYDALPDWFLVFDVYDRERAAFWDCARRNALARSAGLCTVPELGRGHFTAGDLKRLVNHTPSRYRPGPVEGLVLRREEDGLCRARAKIVRADFTQAIQEHWQRRAIQWNRLGEPKPGGR